MVPFHGTIFGRIRLNDAPDLHGRAGRDREGIQVGLWWPKSEQELLAAIEARELRETRWLEAKRGAPRDGEAIASDVAGMANHGGVIIYGVDEDKDRIIVGVSPFPLADESERLVQAVSSRVHGWPYFDVQPMPTAGDPSVGYLVVVVPASARAPHLVEGQKSRSSGRLNHRYWGRHGLVTEPLNGDEVELLFARRREVDRDRTTWLRDQRARDVSGVRASPSDGVLCVAVSPALPDTTRLERIRDRPPSDYLIDVATETFRRPQFRGHSAIYTETLVCASASGRRQLPRVHPVATGRAAPQPAAGTRSRERPLSEAIRRRGQQQDHGDRRRQRKPYVNPAQLRG